MRNDQPKLKKQFKELNAAIGLLKRKLDHRENIIEYLVEQKKDVEEAALIAIIEHDRLLAGKPALTTSYAIIRDMAASVSEM